jgi:MFS family permease
LPILFGVILLDLVGFGIVIPILPFLSPQLGASKMDIAYIVVCYAVCAGFSGPFWGRLSDRVGRKPVIMICLAGAAISYVLLGLSTELWMIYAARCFAGLMAGNFGVGSAMMADITTPENRARGMGLTGAAFGLGLVLGPLLGGVLSGDDGSFMLPCLVAGVMSVSAIVAAAVFLPESLSPERRAAHREQQKNQTESIYQMLKRTSNRLLVFQYVLHASCVSAITYIIPLWVGDLLGWGAREVGIMFGIQGAIMVLLQGGLIGPLVKLLGEFGLLRINIAAMLCGLLTAVFAGTMGLMVAAAFLALSGATLCMPVLNAITSHRTPISERGRMMGTTGAASSWGRVVGPLMGGFTLAAFGYSGAWIACICVATVYFGWALSENRGSFEPSVRKENTENVDKAV